MWWDGVVGVLGFGLVVIFVSVVGSGSSGHGWGRFYELGSGSNEA